MRGDSVRVQDKKDVITTISKFEFFESDDNDDQMATLVLNQKEMKID